MGYHVRPTAAAAGLGRTEMKTRGNDLDDQAKSGTLAACLTAMGSALMTGFLLFLNGGGVLAAVNTLASGGLEELNDDRFSQFLVLFGPVLMVVVQWMMIDYLRAHLGFWTVSRAANRKLTRQSQESV